jgi:ABC-type transport system involved in multi-copper enzyme maturation permease subunit
MGTKDWAGISHLVSRAGVVARRDLRDATSELRLVLAMVALTLAIPIASAIGVRALAYFGGGTAVVNRLAVVGAFFVVFIPASFSLVLALEAFVGERERTTLEVLLSTPLSEAEIYVGKVAAVLAVSLGLCYGGLIVYCVAVFPGLGYFPLSVLIALALSTICQVAAMVAGAVIISLNARTMRAANVMASFIILPMSVVLQVEAALILIGRPEFLWGFAALMTVLAVVLLRMGLAGFSREALLAREVGLGKPLRRAIAALRWSFGGRPGIVRLVWMRRLPLAVAAFGFVAGIGVGFVAGRTAAIPAPVVKPVLSSLLNASGGTTPVQDALAIFGHNLLAFVLVAVLAIFTAGLSGFALTFLPGFLLGYAAALSSWSVALGGVVPNGLVEIPAAIVAGGLVIQIGATAIHMEPGGGWTARTLSALADYVRSLRWLVPALALAALLEVRFG